MGKIIIIKSLSVYLILFHLFFSYLERQDFLQRTDLRQFEIEKNLRQTTRPKF